MENNGVDTAATQMLSPMETDAIGEVMNICMGSAATAVSSMLDKPVSITTPRVTVEQLGKIDYQPLEPALLVKIVYTEGVEGANVMVLRQRDMQLIINQLMGVDEPPRDDFEFDELSMSAACEVMNQMMGAAATALSDFLGKTINISTPQASVMQGELSFSEAMELPLESYVASILFDMEVEGILSTQFVSVFTCEFVREVVQSFMQSAAPAPAPQPAAPAPAPQQAPPMQQQAPPMQQQAPPMQQQAPPMQQQAPPMQQQMPPMQQPPAGYYMPPQQAYPPQAAAYAQYGAPPMYAQQPPAPAAPAAPPVQVQNVRFPAFQALPGEGEPLLDGHMDLLLNVPLDVEIVIGSAKRKIKEILDFNQGTVIELNKQAGAPVDVMVNGKLLAHGDVVVIDDNFGVRITDIVGTKELLNSLDEKI